MRGACAVAARRRASWVAAFVIGVSSALHAGAAPVDRDRALDAVTGWLDLSPRPMDRKAGAVGTVSTVAGPTGEPVFHVVHLTPTGFAIIAADDDLETVVAFSHEDTFVARAGQPLFDMLRSDVGARVLAARAAAATGRPPSAARLRANAKWRALLARGTRTAAALAPGDRAVALQLMGLSDVRVEPLVQTRWDQSWIDVGLSALAVYNYYTPPFGPGNLQNYPAGCTATGWAQIMRYHQWPKEGVGPQAFSITVDGLAQNRPLRGGNGSGGPYDWANMVLAPGPSITDVQRQAIGALLHDAGVVNHMQYSYSDSAASLHSDTVRSALHYANIAYKDGFSDDLLLALRTNLDAGLPTAIVIWNYPIGHMPVCDGYGYNTGTLYHHLNMGWSGSNDAWYNLPNVDDSYYGFNLVSGCSYNICPDAAGEIISGRIVGPDGAGMEGVTVTARGPSVRGAVTNRHGIFAFKGVDSNTTWTLSARAAGYIFAPASVALATGLSQDFSPVGDRTADFTGTVRTSANPETPVLNWPAPAAIAEGVALSAIQLNAATDVPGTFSYSPAAGTVLAVGSHVVSVTFTPEDTNLYTSATAQVTLVVASGRSRLVNIATRAYCATGNRVTIGGFVVSGGGSKRVLVRAVGPTLTSQGLTAAEVLADPLVEVHKGSAVIAQNDNWGDNANAAEITTVGARIGANPFSSGDTGSAALLLTLDPGVYSFIVKGHSDASGIVLLEVYDAEDAGSGANFVNIATRAQATTGDGVAIGGFVIQGGAPKQVLLRAVGPTLATQGLGQSEVLSDPTIELHHGAITIASNDNWPDTGNAAAIAPTAARIGATPFAAGDRTSSALLLTLDPGVYTFIAKGRNDTSGIVLVEVYDAD